MHRYSFGASKRQAEHRKESVLEPSMIRSNYRFYGGSNRCPLKHRLQARATGHLGHRNNCIGNPSQVRKKCSWPVLLKTSALEGLAAAARPPACLAVSYFMKTSTANMREVSSSPGPIP